MGWQMGQPGFFDLDERYRRLSETGDPLVRLAGLIDFEVFRPQLDAALRRFDGSRGGRPPYDCESACKFDPLMRVIGVQN